MRAKWLGKRVAVALVLLPLLFSPGAGFPPRAEAASPENQEETREQAEREREARQNLWHLQYVIKNDGFFSQRVALNVWRASAIEADTFDPRLYENFTKEIYQRSIDRNWRFVQLFLLQKNSMEAANCLEIWRIHSLALDAFDPGRYDSMKQKIMELKNSR